MQLRRRGSGSNSSPGVVLREDKPVWLENLINTSSECQSCGVHDTNIFCLHCHLSICSRCLPPHRCLQVANVHVGRWRNQEVVERAGLKKLIRCSDIKPYATKIGDAIVLKWREQESGPSKAVKAHTCLHCGKNINSRLQFWQEYNYCSLSCKIEYQSRAGKPLKDILLSTSELRVDNLEAINEDVPGSSRPNNNGITSCLPWKKLRWRRKTTPRRAPFF